MYLILLYAMTLIFGGVCWYFYFGLELWMNGGEPNHLRGLQEELLWVLPGGRRRRGEYIRRIVDAHEGEGYMGNWSYEVIRRRKCYEEVGCEMLPGLGHFLFTHVAIPLGPTAAAFAISQLI